MDSYSSGRLHLTNQVKVPASTNRNHEVVCPGKSSLERIVSVPGRKTFGRFTVYIDEQSDHSFFSFSRNGKDEYLGKYCNSEVKDQAQPGEARKKSILEMTVTYLPWVFPACIYLVTQRMLLVCSAFIALCTYNLVKKQAAKIVDEQRIYSQKGVYINSIPHVTFHLDQEATKRFEKWLETQKKTKQLTLQAFGDNCSDFVREGFQKLGFNREYIDYFPESFLKMSGKLSPYIVFRQACSWPHFFKRYVDFSYPNTILPSFGACTIKRICKRIIKRNDQFEKLLLANKNSAAETIASKTGTDGDNGCIPSIYGERGKISPFPTMLKNHRFRELSKELQESVVSIQEKLSALQKSNLEDRDAEYMELLEFAIMTQHWSERAICKLEGCGWTYHKFSSTSSQKALHQGECP